MRKTTRAKFSYTIENGVICIIDHDGDVSVTNDAENVISELIEDEAYLESRKVIYRDTTGNWDELVVKNYAFSHFNLIGTSSKSLAISKVTTK